MSEVQQEQMELDLGTAGDEHQIAVEQEARLYGWVPREEFRGDESEWVDADRFVQRGKEINPILRKNNERLLRELNSTKSELDELKLTVREFGEMYKKMSEGAYKRAIDDVKAQLKLARRDGDLDLADDLSEQLDTLKEESKNIQVPGRGDGTPPSDRGPNPDGQRILQEWMTENPWYSQQNPDLYYAAEGIALRLAKEQPRLVGKREFLDEVAARVRETMPSRFESPRRKAGSPVSSSSGSTAAPRNGGKRSYNDLPPEAKAACDRFVKSIPGFSREKYVKTYFEE